MTESTCPACRGSRFRGFRARGGTEIHRCLECGSGRLHHDNGDGARGFTYEREYFESWNLEPGSPAWNVRAATAALRLETLRELGATGGALLDVGAAGGYLVALANERGFDARGVEISEHAVKVARQVVPGRVLRGTLETLEIEPGSLDVVTLFDVLEHMPAPAEALHRIARWLRPRGYLALTTPDVDSLSAKLMAGAWPHYKEEHLFYPSRRGLKLLVESAGFEIRHEEPARKYLSVAFAAPLFERYPVVGLTPAASFLQRILPRPLREASFRVSIGERLLVSSKR
jgi:SAM-dependent methyltransferase